MRTWEVRQINALASAWNTYRVWAKTSREAVQRIRRSRATVLALTIAGSVLGTVAQFVGATAAPGTPAMGTHRLLAMTGALALALSTYFVRELIDDETQRKWLRARAVAESAKSEIYLFRVGVSPYDGNDAGAKLLQTRDAQMKLVEGIAHASVLKPEEVGNVPNSPLTPLEYQDQRVKTQIVWYDERVAEYETYLSRAKLCTWVLGVVSVMISVVAVKDLGTTVIPLIGALTAALTAHVTTAQYSYILTSYQAAADQLRSEVDAWNNLPDNGDAGAVSAFVHGCEGVMAGETSSWMAKLSAKVTTANGPPARPDTKAQAVSIGAVDTASSET